MAKALELYMQKYCGCISVKKSVFQEEMRFYPRLFNEAYI